MAAPPPPPKNSFWRLFTKPEAPAPTPEEEPELKEVHSSTIRFNREFVYWAMRDLPATEATNHFLVCGTTGSGKSKTIQLFLQSIAPRFAASAEEPEQLILFDAKGDALQLLANNGIDPTGENVYILNPFDTRSAVWNVAEAVQAAGMPRALATLLIPEDTRSTARYFTDAAREIVIAVIHSLNASMKSKWSLRDLLCAMESLDKIRRITGRLPGAERMVARYLNDDAHIHGVISSMASQLGRFETVAALWDTNTSGTTFSMEEFLNKPGVLVLGNDPVLRESFWPINAILLKSLVNTILRGEERRTPRYWFVLDEFRAMEKVECIQELLNRGRSKGASVLLGIQSVEGLVDVYGQSSTNDLLGLCTNKTFLRAGGHSTAEWIERYFSQVRRTDPIVSETNGNGGYSRSVQYSTQDRPLFLASYFLDLPLPRRDKPFVAVCDVPCLGETLIVQRNFNDVLKLCREADEVLNLIPRKDDGGQLLIPWSSEKFKAVLDGIGKTGGSTSGKQEAPVTGAGPVAPATAGAAPGQPESPLVVADNKTASAQSEKQSDPAEKTGKTAAEPSKPKPPLKLRSHPNHNQSQG